MEQVKFVDVHRYYRAGGIDPVKLVRYRLAIIAAAVGLNPNPILQEQVDLMVASGLAYATYTIPVAVGQGSMESQADFYLDLYGVRDGLTIVDIEEPYKDHSVRCINSTEALRFRARLERFVTLQPWNYTSPAYMQYLGHPNWLCDAPLWMAQWYWYVYKKQQYPDWETFLAKYANVKPSYVRTGVGKKYANNLVAWQFSAQGDAQRLIANPTTNDPKYQNGIRAADLNVSLIEPAQFMEMFGTASAPPPTIPKTLDERVTALETWAGGLGYVP